VIADQLRDTADTVVSDLDIVTPALRGVICASHELAELLAARRGELAAGNGETANASLASFSAFGEEMEGVLDILIQSGVDAARKLSAASSLPMSDESLRQLEMFADQLEVFFRSDEALETDDTILELLSGAFAARYSMASERDIHNTFSAGSNTGPSIRAA
jgi:hypothetical protein